MGVAQRGPFDLGKAPTKEEAGTQSFHTFRLVAKAHTALQLLLTYPSSCSLLSAPPCADPQSPSRASCDHDALSLSSPPTGAPITGAPNDAPAAAKPRIARRIRPKPVQRRRRPSRLSVLSVTHACYEDVCYEAQPVSAGVFGLLAAGFGDGSPALWVGKEAAIVMETRSRDKLIQEDLPWTG